MSDNKAQGHMVDKMLQHDFELTLDLGPIPVIWKLSNFTPLPKKINFNKPNNCLANNTNNPK